MADSSYRYQSIISSNSTKGINNSRTFRLTWAIRKNARVRCGGVGGRLSAVHRRKPTSECRRARRLDLLDPFRGRRPTSRCVAMGPGAFFLLAIRDNYSVTMLSKEENKQYVTLMDPKQGCESELLGVMAKSQELELIKPPLLRFQNILFESVI